MIKLASGQHVHGRATALPSGLGTILDFFAWSPAKKETVGSLRVLSVHYDPDRPVTWAEVLEVIAEGASRLRDYMAALEQAVTLRNQPISRRPHPFTLGLAGFLRIPSFDPKERVGSSLLEVALSMTDQLIVWAGGISFDTDDAFTADVYKKGLNALGFKGTEPRWVDPIYRQPFQFASGTFQKQQRFDLPPLTQTSKPPLPVERVSKREAERRKRAFLEKVEAPSSPLLQSFSVISLAKASKQMRLAEYTLTHDPDLAGARLPLRQGSEREFNEAKLLQLVDEAVQRRDPVASVDEAIHELAAAGQSATLPRITKWLQEHRTEEELDAIARASGSPEAAMLSYLVGRGFLTQSKIGGTSTFSIKPS